ncbi:MAG: hypothetical protein H6736_10610 [Alphaproteobacteria bacterium]|nr:hypothetical protein [Alphaproteobacteria bacterium]
MTSLLVLSALLTGCSRCDSLIDLGFDGEKHCAVGKVRLSTNVGVEGVQRNALGTLSVVPMATWITEPGPRSSVPVARAFPGEVKVSVRLEGSDLPVVLTAMERKGEAWVGRLTLPDVPDGDHVLVVDVDAGFDRTTARVSLALYEPALVHVLTDRPLYRPGEDVNLRSLVLARANQVPLGDRPGRWSIRSPDGVEVLDEPARAEAWGVAATSLPLDPEAPQGTWQATYRSGSDTDTVSFDVRPFELPKTTATASATRPWAGSRDPVAIEGSARYRSGAPIADAPFTATLRSSGQWPLPLAWREPVKGRTGPDGSFEVDWGPVPDDIRDVVELEAYVVVEEEGGERPTASAGLVLSEHTIRAAALTELGEALASGLNNRAYIRVMQPDGTPLANTDVTVRNPWKPTQKAWTARADADGVVSIQVDPGDPVTLVTEPMPVRRPPAPPPAAEDTPSVLQITGAFDRPLTLVEQRVIPVVEAAVARCQLAQTGAQQVSAWARVVGGRSTFTGSTADTPTGACVADALKGVSWPEKGPETYTLRVSLPKSLRPSLDPDTRTTSGDGDAVQGLVANRLGQARACMRPGVGEDGAEAFQLHWLVVKGSRNVTVDVADSGEHGLDASTAACVSRAYQGLAFPEPVEETAIGVTRLQLDVPALPGVPKPPPPPPATTQDGFELTVAVARDGVPVGSTPLRFDIGSMPPVRVRVTPPVVTAGEVVTVELLRSGDMKIELPEKLALKQHGKVVMEAELDGNKAVFDVPADTDGFYDVSFMASAARLFVQRPDHLSLTLTPDRTTYRPGETARITVRTLAGDAGRQAAVGLVGVDAGLGQLMPLPGPDAYGRVTVRAKSREPAFGAFDATSLLMGRIRGENARQAAVLRITEVPTDRFERRPVGGMAIVAPNQTEALDAAFARAWAATVERVHAWERGAAESEKLDYPRMRTFWEQALRDLRQAGTPAEDAYGRELALRWLPPSYLDQLDPRAVVGDKTRLPEDLVGWRNWVTSEVTDG